MVMQGEMYSEDNHIAKLKSDREIVTLLSCMSIVYGNHQGLGEMKNSVIGSWHHHRKCFLVMQKFFTVTKLPRLNLQLENPFNVNHGSLGLDTLRERRPSTVCMWYLQRCQREGKTRGILSWSQVTPWMTSPTHEIPQTMSKESQYHASAKTK
jgi:hypothetical protein